MTAAPDTFSPPMVAVAPPWLRGSSSATAAPAVVAALTATNPDTSATAARRAAAAPRRCTNGAENEESTDFPFEQDPLTWGVTVPPAESAAPRAMPGILRTG